MRSRSERPRGPTWLEKRFNILVFWITAGAALLYSARNYQYKTGIINDDAVFVMGARMMRNSLMFDSLVLKPDYPLPGLPLILAPWVKWIEPEWTRLEWFPVLISGLSVLLLGKLARRWCSPGETLAVMALFAFNPVFSRFSGILMPANFYTAAMIGGYLLMGNWLDKPTLAKAIGLGFVLGWASILRPEGVVLLASIVPLLVVKRHGRALIYGMALPLVFWVFVLQRWWRLFPGAKSEYRGDLDVLFSYWAQNWDSGIAFVWRLLEVFVIQGLVFLRLSINAVPSWLAAVGVTMCLVGIFWGFYAVWKEKNTERTVLLSAAIFCALFFSIHVYWKVTTPRYAIPLMPFVLIFLVRGFHSALSRIGLRHALAGVVLAVALGNYAYQQQRAVHESLFTPDPMKAPPWRTLAWLNQNTPADAKVISNIAPNIELYSNRPALSGMNVTNSEMLLYQIKKNGFSYVVIRQLRFLASGVEGTDDPNRTWARMELRVAHHPEHFLPVFADPIEQTTVFHIESEPEYIHAYDVLTVAYQNYQAGRLADAYRSVNECLTLYPRLGSATNLLGALYWRAHKLKLAESAFIKTLELLPLSTNAMLNLATLYQQQGQNELSRAYVQRAMTSAAVKGEQKQLDKKIHELHAQWEQKSGLIFLDVP